MLSNYIEQLFKLDNYYDGLIVTDNKGYIEFFMTYRPDISGAKQEDLVGKHVLDIYPGLTEETSTIMRVLRSGEPDLQRIPDLDYLPRGGISIR